MTREEIIEGLRFTVGMFLVNPFTGEERDEESLNNLDKTTVDACRGAIKILEQEPEISIGSTIKNDLAVEEFAERVLKAMDFAIKATDSKDNYSIGMRNGIRYSKSLIDSKEPDFEHIENDNCDKGCDFCKHTSECMPSKE